jgi:hypothetical protein
MKHIVQLNAIQTEREHVLLITIVQNHSIALTKIAGLLTAPGVQQEPVKLQLPIHSNALKTSVPVSVMEMSANHAEQKTIVLLPMALVSLLRVPAI